MTPKHLHFTNFHQVSMDKCSRACAFLHWHRLDHCILRLGDQVRAVSDGTEKNVYEKQEDYDYHPDYHVPQWIELFCPASPLANSKL